MQKFMKQFTLTLLLSFIIIATTSAQDVDDIIDQYLEKTGGKKEWRKLESMKMEGTVPTFGMEFPITILSKSPNLIRVEVAAMGMSVIPQAFDGKVAWLANPMTGVSAPQKMSATDTKAMHSSTEFAPPYLDYKKKGHEIKLEGKKTVNGKECFKLVITKNKHNEKDEVIEYHYFDTATYLPVMVSNTGSFGEGKGKLVERYLSNYKKVGNLTIPHYIEVKMNGALSRQITINRIVLNETIDNRVFNFPN